MNQPEEPDISSFKHQDENLDRFKTNLLILNKNQDVPIISQKFKHFEQETKIP